MNLVNKVSDIVDGNVVVPNVRSNNISSQFEQ
jgi:hypothetical protein